VSLSMTRVKIDNELFQTVAHFSKQSGVTPKDVIVGQDGSLNFVVEQQDIGRAVGPQGRNVHNLEQALNRRVRIIAYASDLPTFIQNVIRPLQIADMGIEAGIVTLQAADNRSRSLLIGRAAQHLRTFEAIIQRFFPDVKELKVA
jgi:N utilization substance protein A